MTTYQELEEARIQPLLVELYEFKVGVLTYRYTSSDQDMVPSDGAGHVYASEYFERTTVAQNEELNKENVTVSVHRDNAVAKLYWKRPPDQTIIMSIWRYHHSNTLEQEVVLYWSGRILSCSFKGTVAELVCEATSTSMKQPGLTRKYQGSCPHPLYSVNCKVVRANQEFYTNVSVSTGDVIEATGASAYADNHFTGGYLNWLGSDGNQQSRMIYSHTGEQLTLDWEIAGMKVLDQLWIYPGCKHNMSDCFNKFMNIINYGGFPYVPEKNPYETTVY